MLVLESPCPATLSFTTQKVNLIMRVVFFLKRQHFKNVFLALSMALLFAGWKCCVEGLSYILKKCIPQIDEKMNHNLYLKL